MAEQDLINLQAPGTAPLPASASRLSPSPTSPMVSMLGPTPSTMKMDASDLPVKRLDAATLKSRLDQSIKLYSLSDDVLFQIFASLAHGNRLRPPHKIRLRHVLALAYSHSRLYAAYKRFLISYSLKPIFPDDTFGFTDSPSDNKVARLLNPIDFWLRLRGPGIATVELIPHFICCSNDFAAVTHALLESAPRLRRVKLVDFDNNASRAAYFVAKASQLTRLFVVCQGPRFFRAICQAVQPKLRVLEIFGVSSNDRALVVAALKDLAVRSRIFHLVIRFMDFLEAAERQTEFEVYHNDLLTNRNYDSNSENNLTPAGIAASLFSCKYVQCARLVDVDWARGQSNCTLCKSTRICGSLDPTGNVVVSDNRPSGCHHNVHEQWGQFSDTRSSSAAGINNARVRVNCRIGTYEGLRSGQYAISVLKHRNLGILFRAFGFVSEGVPCPTARIINMFKGMRIIRAELKQMLAPCLNGPIVSDWRHVQMVDASCVACQDGIKQLESSLVQTDRSNEGNEADGALNVMNIVMNNDDVGLQKGPIDALGLLTLTRTVALSACSLKAISISHTDGAEFSSLCIHVVGVLFRHAPQLSVLNIGVDVLISAAQLEKLDRLLVATRSLRVLHITTKSLVDPVAMYLLSRQPNYCHKTRRIVETYPTHVVNIENRYDRFYDDDEDDSSDDDKDSILDERPDDVEDNDSDVQTRHSWKLLSPVFFVHFPVILDTICRLCRNVEIVAIHGAEPCDGVFIPKDFIPQSLYELDTFQNKNPTANLWSVRNMLNAWNEEAHVETYSPKRNSSHEGDTEYPHKKPKSHAGMHYLF